MSKINLLSSKVYNRIAAGEVVERPSSVVKELIENSIDAGSNSISLEILDGGISSIIIRDNGCGIEKSELKKALLPHATSKISSVKDLDAIETLGFRGEALASIASVSKITIKSKPNNQDFGAEISFLNDEFTEIKDSATENGTEITVNNLFYNTPVRAKFLKSEKSEEGEIIATVARFILGHPDLAFKIVSNGKTVLQSFGDGEESAFVCVYGAKTTSDCFYVCTEKNGVKINGYLGKHYFTKANRGHQTVFLNGRYVVNNTISSAIANAYSSYLMKRQYPFYVLNIEIPSDAVDVNVHPNKIDVRFINNQIIYSAIYSVVSKVLDGSSEALNIVTENNIHKGITINNQVISNEIDSKNVRHDTNHIFDNLTFKDSGAKSLNEKINFTNENKEVEDIFSVNKAYIDELERKKQNIELKEQNQIKIEKDLTLIGQALNTFLILEDSEDLYFIDQHAAHERLLFDKLNSAVLNNELVSQPLLVPYIISVDNKESDFLREKIEILTELGIEIEEFGLNTFKVSALPVFLGEINIEQFFKDILFDLDTLKKITVNDLLREKLAQKACKSAIKSGDKMSENEIEMLLKMLKGNLGLKCPHGRPIAIKITRTEIDKWFKRII